MITKPIKELFDFIPETNIIEEDAYDKKGIYPVYSGQTENDGIMAKINEYNQDRQCVAFTTYGVNAGTLNFIEGKFTIGRNCMGLIPKDEYAHLINLEWFSFKYQNLFYRNRIGDITGQRSLNKKLLENVVVNIPDYETVQKKELIKYKKIKISIKKIDKLIFRCNELLNCKTFVDTIKYRDIISKIFYIHGGNTGLTKKFIYMNEPTNKDDEIKILSGATLDTNSMGYIAKEAEYEGRKIKKFKAPCLLVARKGYAGNITYIEDGEFTTNDDAYVFELKKDWKGKVNMRWFAFQYQELFYNLTTSKSDNSTFNKTYAEKQEVIFPKIEKQNDVAEKLYKIDALLVNLMQIKDKLYNLIEYEII